MAKNCRYCNTPMKKGFIAANKVIWWTEEEPGMLMKKSDANIKLSSSNTSWARLAAKHCTTCKTIMVSYD